MLVEIWKANLLRSPAELRDNGGGALLVREWHTKSQAELCSCPSVLWEGQLVSKDTGHLAEAISKQSIK